VYAAGGGVVAVLLVLFIYCCFFPSKVEKPVVGNDRYDVGNTVERRHSGKAEKDNSTFDAVTKRQLEMDIHEL